MFHVFFTNELSIKKNEINLFETNLVKKPYIFKNCTREIGPNRKTYIKLDESKSVKGFIVTLNVDQLWIMDQWMDIPLSERKVKKVRYDNNLIELYYYTLNNKVNVSKRPNNALVKDNIINFNKKKNMNALGPCDLHLIYPCSFDQYEIPKMEGILSECDTCGDPYRIETQEELDQFEASQFFVCKLNDNSKYEFNDVFITSIKRIPLGTIKCCFTYGEDLYEEYGFAYISKHSITGIGTFSIVFPCITNPVILQLYAFCENVLKIVDGYENIEVTEWLKRKKIELYGYPKAVIFSYNSQIKKNDILKCLAFEMEPMADIISKKLNEWASDNIAQYNLAEVYASDRCLIEVRKDIEINVFRRLKSQSIEIFFIEILLFQEAAISRVCSRVSYYLNDISKNANCKNSFEILSKLSKEMANAIMFIDHKRLRYPSVRLSSEEIATRFGLPEELDKYYKYREILDEMINLNSNEQDKIESTLMNFLLLVLTMIQVLPTIKTFIDILMTGEINVRDGISLAFSLMTCSLFYIIFRVFKWRTIKRLSKNRGEHKKSYDNR